LIAIQNRCSTYVLLDTIVNTLFRHYQKNICSLTIFITDSVSISPKTEIYLDTLSNKICTFRPS